MNENEIMTTEEVEMEPEVNETYEGGTKSNFGLGILLGGLAAAGIYAATKQIKKQIAKRKARKGDIVDAEYEDVNHGSESETESEKPENTVVFLHEENDK